MGIGEGAVVVGWKCGFDSVSGHTVSENDPDYLRDANSGLLMCRKCLRGSLCKRCF